MICPSCQRFSVSPQLITSLFLGCFLSSPLLARFYPEEEKRIDSEHSRSKEAYNDQISYESSRVIKDQFAASDYAFFASAGSLNQDIFLYQEQIKAEYESSEGVSIGLRQNTFEDAVHKYYKQKIWVGIPIGKGFSLELLGDTRSEKMWSDYGLALNYKTSSNDEISLTYWAVDIFHNEKRLTKGDKNITNSHTVEGALIFGFDWGRIEADFEYDSPLEWQRNTLDYVYHYEMGTANVHIKDISTDYGLLSFDYHYRWKHEKKFFREPFVIPIAVNDYQRETHRTTVSLYRPEQDHLHMGAEFLITEVDGGFRSFIGDDTDLDYREYVQPGLRREYMLFATQKLSSPNRNHWQIGMHLNFPQIRFSNKTEEGLEAKLQTIYELVWSDRARFVINATWDLDQVVEDFPFDEQSFSPWGGGNVQILVTL